MELFGFGTDWKVARDFYNLVQANLYYDDLVEDEKTGEASIKRPFSPSLDLFTLRDEFLGCVYYKLGDRIAGLYCLTEKDNNGYVDSAYVAHVYRGRGIGFQLLQRACDKLIEMGKTPVCVVVRSAAMDRLLDRLAYPVGTIRKQNVCYDKFLAELKDHLFTEHERPTESI